MSSEVIQSSAGSGSTVSATGGNEFKSVTLNSSNGWKQTFYDLPLTGKAEDGTTQVSYYYYFVEESVPAGYVVSYSNGENAVQSGTVTITNTQTPTPSGTSLTVKKVWKDANGDPLTVDDSYSVTVKLAQVATTITDGTTSEIIQQKDIQNENEWNQWNLDADQLGKSNLSLRITYETSAGHGKWPCGTVSVYDSSNDSSKDPWKEVSKLYIASNDAGTYSETISLGNLSSNITMVSVNFFANDTDGAYGALKSVELVETVITDGQTTVAVDEDYSTQTLNSGNNWEYRWTNLSASDDNGTTYTYYVKEVRVENAQHDNITDKFTVTNSNGDKDHAVGVSGEIVITNTLKTTYVLPGTGGAGTGFYRIGGSLLIGMAAAGLIGNTKRQKRKEADKTS